MADASSKKKRSGGEAGGEGSRAIGSEPLMGEHKKKKRPAEGGADGEKKKRAKDGEGGEGRKGGDGKKSYGKPKKKKLSWSAQKKQEEARMTPKELKRKRQEARPNYEKVSKAKEIWNKLREKNLEAGERQQLMGKLLPLIRGKIAEVAMKHDASRVVQAAIKYADDAQRTEILGELTPHVVEMSKATFSSYVVKKLFRYCTKEQHATLVKQFQHKVAKLGTHQVAANVVEHAATWLPARLWHKMRREFYGQEFAFFATDESVTVASALADAANPRRGAAALGALGAVLAKIVTKGLLDLTYVHELLAEYLENAEPTEVLHMATTLQDAPLHLASTREGTRAACACVAYGGPKQRKHMIKSMKDHVLKLATHPHAYLLLMRVLDVVDDTVLVGKTVLAELAAKPEDLLAVATHPQGRKVLLHLLRPRHPMYNDPAELALMAPALAPKDLAALSTEEGRAAAASAAGGRDASAAKKQAKQSAENLVPTSKKAPSRRRNELLDVMKAPLEALCAAHAQEMMMDPNGADVLVEVVGLWGTEEVVAAAVEAAVNPQVIEVPAPEETAPKGAFGHGGREAFGGGGGGDGGGSGGSSGSGSDDDDDAAVAEDGGEESDGPVEEEDKDAEMAAAAEEEEEEEREPDAPHEDAVGHRTLRRLVAPLASTLDGSSMCVPSVNFGVMLAQRLLAEPGALFEWATSSRGAHVVAYMLRELPDPEAAKKELLAKKAKLTKITKRAPEHGASLVVDFLEGKLLPKEGKRDGKAAAAAAAAAVAAAAAAAPKSAKKTKKKK
jgi:pumilio family protein 6